MRKDGRKSDELRAVKITRNYTKYAEGSVLVEFGDTKVLCNATVSNDVPPFLKNSGKGWITAEYAMLPRATAGRTQRDGAKGKVNGRNQEIQRLIGRALRSIFENNKLKEKTIIIDADVIQADGGTRTAAITGAYVALRDAVDSLLLKGEIAENPLRDYVAAVSVGISGGEPVLDLNYQEDSNAEVDMNVVMTGAGEFIEIQATAEKKTFTQEQHAKLLEFAKNGIACLVKIQKEALGIKY